MSGGGESGLPDDAPGDVVETFARVKKALDGAAPEDRDEMVDLMQDIRDALATGSTEDVAALKQELDELLFFVE